MWRWIPHVHDLFAVFQTATKASSTISFGTLAAICQSVRIPVVAIGGLKSDNVKDCLQAGCKGVAIVSAIFGQENPSQAAKDIRSQVDEHLHS